MAEPRQQPAASSQQPAWNYWSTATAVRVITAADQGALASLRWQHLRLAVYGCLVALCIGASSAWAADESEKTNEKIVQKELTGQVVWIGKHAISVEYDRDATSSYEMLLPVTGDLELERLKNLSELKRGDTIHVEYRQTVKQGEDGQEMVVKTVATKVALMRQTSPEGTLRSKNETTLE